MDPRLQTPLFLGSFGLIFFLVGVWTAWTTWSEPPNPVTSLPVVDARGLTDVGVGTEVLVEGRLAASTPVLREGLAVLQREVAKGRNPPGSNDIRFSFEPAGTEAPPFELETSSGAVRVQLAPEATWSDVPRTIEADPGTVTAGKERLSGFAPSDAVTVQGKVVSGPALEAQVIRGGTAADYRAQVEKSGKVGLVLGGLFALAGLGALITAALQAMAVFRTR